MSRTIVRNSDEQTRHELFAKCEELIKRYDMVVSNWNELLYGFSQNGRNGRPPKWRLANRGRKKDGDFRRNGGDRKSEGQNALQKTAQVRHYGGGKSTDIMSNDKFIDGIRPKWAFGFRSKKGQNALI